MTGINNYSNVDTISTSYHNLSPSGNQPYTREKNMPLRNISCSTSTHITNVCNCRCAVCFFYLIV